LLARVRPLDIMLGITHQATSGLLAHAAYDKAGQAQAYALVRADRTVEIVAALRTGCWPPDYRAWWPGAYEKPLLAQLQPVYLPLAAALQLAPAWLCMSLLDIGGTALIANNQLGNERAYPFPNGQGRLDLPPVVLDASPSVTMDALIDSFDQVRAHAKVADPHAFYL
jgi:hypothetical protein